MSLTDEQFIAVIPLVRIPVVATVILLVVQGYHIAKTLLREPGRITEHDVRIGRTQIRVGTDTVVQHEADVVIVRLRIIGDIITAAWHRQR